MKLSGPIRNMSPCKACGEKFEACHSCCPKDAMGNYLRCLEVRAEIESIKL